MPDLALLQNVLALTLFGLCMACVLGSTLIALVSEMHGWTAKRVFSVKFALQTGRLALVALLVPLTVLLALGAVLYQSAGKEPGILHILSWPAVFAACGLFGLLGYVLTANALGRARIIKVMLLCFSLASVAGLTVLLSGTLLFVTGILPDPGDARLASMTPLQILVAAQIAFLAPGSAGIIGLLYLVARRNRDDFGRDYYRWSAPAAAKWGMAAPLCLLSLPWIMTTAPHPGQAVFTSISFLLPVGSSFLLAFAAAGICLAIVRHDNPMRLKGRMLLAALCLFLCCGLLTSLYLGPLAPLL